MAKIFIVYLVFSLNYLYAQKTQRLANVQHEKDYYHNPILPGDFQNTDVIRVGKTYYYISATKELSPGMLILSSIDLVNWKIIGHAVEDITAISPQYNYDKMNGKSRGIWAGSIRYHNHKFYIYFTDPDEGLFMTTAINPAGPWQSLKLLKKGAGWDDPCPLWDDDGKAYLVMTNFADRYKIKLFQLAVDGKKLLDSGRVIHQSEGSEANKLYKINHYYYHFYSEVTPEGRMPFITRAENIYGPYTQRRQLIHKATAEPNQGGMVKTITGDWYFVTHHGNAYWSGREASLLPVKWVAGWPVWGKVGADGIGNMVWSGKRPVLNSFKLALQTSDGFNNQKLSPQWEWYFQPEPKKWSLKKRPGYLRLYASKALQPGIIGKTPNVLTQRPLRANNNVATVKLDIAHLSNGEVAGLRLFGKTFGEIGIRQTLNTHIFYFNDNGRLLNGLAIRKGVTTVWLRSTWNKLGLANFYYSVNSSSFTHLGHPFQITNFGNFLGAKIGLYCTKELESDGFVDFDWFRYTYQQP